MNDAGALATARAVARLAPWPRRRIAGLIALSVAQAALLLPVALLVREVFDDDVPGHDSLAIVMHCVLAACCYALSGVAVAVSRALAASMVKDAMAAARVRLVDQLQTLPLSWHDRQPSGRLYAVVMQDCERVDHMVTAVLGQVLPAAATLVVLVGVGLAVDPLLCVLLLGVTPVLIVGARRFARAFAAKARAWHDAGDALGAHAHVLLDGLATIRAAGAEGRERARFGREIDTYVDAAYDAAVAGSRHQAAQGALAAIAGVGVLMAGGLLVAAGELSVGSLLAFYAVIALILRQLTSMSTVAPVVVAGAAAIARVDELEHADDRDAYRGRRELAFGGEIELRDVRFSYGEETVLESVSLHLAAGEQLRIAGGNGAGKTTLMALMLGLYRPQQGEVRADGTPFAELDLRSLRRQCGVILQDAQLFGGTVRDNLLLGAPSAGEDEIATALELSTADEIVAGLPSGLETVLSDGGGGLSGGQRQRLAIARALLARPALVLLDEPTAHLPAELGARVVANLLELPWNPTVVLITHDEHAGAGMRVARLQGGRLVERDRYATAP